MTTTATSVSTSAEHRANTAFARVMDSAPMGLLVSAALGLAIVGVFQYIFYLDVLPTGWQSPLRHAIAIAIAAFFEALGLFFLITTVRDFSARHRREGWIGAAASALLLAYALYEIRHVAATFDRDTPDTYATIIGILATIVVIVRVVELRIALTVTAAIQQADDRKLIADLTGELQAYQAEAADIQRRKLEAEQAEALAAQQRREQEIADMEKENEQLRRRIAAQERKNAATEGITVTQETALRAVRDFMRKNRGFKPTQAQVAAALRTTDRTLRSTFPNGSWDEQIDQLFREINNPQPETASN